MKITDSEIIKNGEQELIDAITADLDWGAIEEIFLKEHNLGIEEDIEYKSGDIVAVDNQIAYKLQFEVKVNLSVLLNRNGEYLSVTISNRNEETDRNEGLEVYEVKSSSKEGNYESVSKEDISSSGDADDIDDLTDYEVENLEENISEEPDTVPFGDLSDFGSDDMGQKVDDILENIKKTG